MTENFVSYNIASTGVDGIPSLEPPQLSESNGGNDMTDSKPILTPPDADTTTTSEEETAPSLTPSSLAGGEISAFTAVNSNKRVTGLWGINQNRNSWVHIAESGWKKLANNSDSAVVALTILAAHAKQSQSNYTFRDEADGMIHESYVW